MISRSSPDAAPFRVTLFFGPDLGGPNGEEEWRCVFNVKKRSWKGGVQVSVDITRDQVERIRSALPFTSWLKNALESVPDDERSLLAQRIDEVFIQILCSRKLNLALVAGLEQESQEISAHSMSSELDRLVHSEREDILLSLHTELDLEGPFHSFP